jgi:hypothetical protein
MGVSFENWQQAEQRSQELWFIEKQIEGSENRGPEATLPSSIRVNNQTGKFRFGPD